MLTPRFNVQQDNSQVFITVHAPYTNIGDAEVEVDGDNFLFVSSPYFLRLRLSGKIVDNDHSKGSYVCDTGEFHLTFDKEVPGEFFENFDMITNMLASKNLPDVNPTKVTLLEDDDALLEYEFEDDNGYENKFAYGFANKLTTEFSNIGNEFPQIFELRSPEDVAIDERHIHRRKYEDEKFSSDHYLADFFDEELLAPYLTSVLNWDSKNIDFTDDDVGVLKELPNKHYLLTKSQYHHLLYGLIDILYGYCYDKRTTFNESTVESSWTINKLSSTLSWFCTFKGPKQALIASYRRALIYPIFRNFELCQKVKNDLVSLFMRGKKTVVKCLIDIHQMFNCSNDARYILNQLYMKDYLVFVQKCTNEELHELCNTIINTNMYKKDLDLDLEELENAAQMVQQEEADIMENEMAVRMASMSLLPDLKKKSLAYNDDSDDESNAGPNSSSDDSTDDSSDELDSDDDSS